jgi:uncharacterized protein
MDQSAKRHFLVRELSGRIAVVRMSPRSEVPPWAFTGSLSAVVRTVDELSIVCDENVIPRGVQSEIDWVAFKVEGPLPFSMPGVLASLLGPLASRAIPVFVISTFNTDYILVKTDQVQRTKETFQAEGHEVA